MSSAKLLAALQQRKQQIQAVAGISLASASPVPVKKVSGPTTNEKKQLPQPSANQQQPPKPITNTHKQQPQPNQSHQQQLSKKKKRKQLSGNVIEPDAEDENAMTDTTATPATNTATGPSPSKKQKLKHPQQQQPSTAPRSTPAPAPAPARKLSALQQKMASKLAAGRFRWLNEKLYTCTGEEAYEYFQAHPEEFDEYHKGFGVQVQEWPVSPLDQFIMYLNERPTLVAGDFGCGEARLAESVKNKVHSFDLVAHNSRVTACNMSAVPLADHTLDVAIFCLSLMGVDFMSFIREAYRTLKPNGILLISEVRSRFEESGIDVFIQAVSDLGFHLRRKDLKNQMFATLEFQKIKSDANGAKKQQGPGGEKKQSSNSTSTGGSAKPSSAPSNKKKLDHQSKSSHPSGAKAATQFTHPISQKKKPHSTGHSSSSSTTSASTNNAPVLSACIYKKR